VLENRPSPFDDLMRGFASGAITRRDFLVRAMALGLSASGAAWLLAACTSSASPSGAAASGGAKSTPKAGGTIRVAYTGAPVGLDPGHVAISFSHYLIEQVYSTLTVIDSAGNVQPELATSWDVAPDGSQYIFHLREGVTFHNGDPLTAEDVKFTFDRLLDKTTGYPFRGYVETIDHVDVVDPSTVKVVMAKAYAPFLAEMSQPGQSIVSKKAVTGGLNLDSKPMGTGPFKFVDYVPGDHWDLVRNDKYFLPGKPYFDKFVGKIITDDPSRTNALIGDLVDFVVEVPGSDWKTVSAASQLTSLSFPSGHYHYIGVNLRKAPFMDKNVRLAMGYALDRQDIVDGVFFGQGTPILGGNIPSWSWAYDPSVHRFGPKADVAKAKEFLAKSSVPNGFDATYLSPTGSAVQNNQGPLIQQNMKAIGINISLKQEDDPAYEGDLFTVPLPRNFEVIDDYWLSPLIDPDDFTYLIMYGGAGTNIIGYNNPQMNSLIDQGRATPDQAKRKEIYSKIQQLQMDDYAFMFTVNANVLHSYNKRLQNYVPDRNGFMKSIRDCWFA